MTMHTGSGDGDGDVGRDDRVERVEEVNGMKNEMKSSIGASAGTISVVNM